MLVSSKDALEGWKSTSENDAWCFGQIAAGIRASQIELSHRSNVHFLAIIVTKIFKK